MENAHEEEKVDVTEEEYETDTSTEDVDETTEESPSEDASEETITINRSDYDKLQRGLARKARLESKDKKDSKGSEESSSQGYDQDLISRTYLAAQAGVTDPEVQDEALRLANKFGMKIDQAMRDPDISTRLKNLQKQRQTQAGIAGNGGQNVGKPKSIDQYVNEFKRTNTLPEDPRLVSQILKELTKK